VDFLLGVHVKKAPKQYLFPGRFRMRKDRVAPISRRDRGAGTASKGKNFRTITTRPDHPIKEPGNQKNYNFIKRKVSKRTSKAFRLYEKKESKEKKTKSSGPDFPLAGRKADKKHHPHPQLKNRKNKQKNG